jgi:hypothetical protein
MCSCPSSVYPYQVSLSDKQSIIEALEQQQEQQHNEKRELHAANKKSVTVFNSNLNTHCTCVSYMNASSTYGYIPLPALAIHYVHHTRSAHDLHVHIC